jgi:hypothetical protein
MKLTHWLILGAVVAYFVWWKPKQAREAEAASFMAPKQLAIVAKPSSKGALVKAAAPPTVMAKPPASPQKAQLAVAAFQRFVNKPASKINYTQIAKGSLKAGAWGAANAAIR